MSPTVVELGIDPDGPLGFMGMDDDELEALSSVELDERELSEDDTDFLRRCVDKTMLFLDALVENPLFPYQRGDADNVELAYRIVESMVLNDGETITALFSRQAGKTEAVADVVAALMILLPKLALIFPEWFGQYKDGLLVGTFAPVESQAETLFQRISARLNSKTAKEIMADDEIDEGIDSDGNRFIQLRGGSSCQMQTANPKANIESKSYHLIIIDEAQRADSKKVNKSVMPMRAFYNGTVVMTGTPDYIKGVFYDTIQHNKRRQTKRGAKQNHFQHDWKSCARYNPRYMATIRKEKERLGEDSEEYRLSYKLEWLLDRGMFTTSVRLEELSDVTMQAMVTRYFDTPVLIGIDPARKLDSTVLTALWVDWNHRNEFGYYDCRVLNWLEMTGERWEEQYGRMVDFCSGYDVLHVGIDAQGVGDVVADRLQRLMPRTHVELFMSDNASQSKRWKHLSELMGQGLIGWPGGARVRRTKTYQRFIKQMEDLEKSYKGKYLLAAAPKAAEAHDDYCDSLALAAMCTTLVEDEFVEVGPNPFYQRSSSR